MFSLVKEPDMQYTGKMVTPITAMKKTRVPKHDGIRESSATHCELPSAVSFIFVSFYSTNRLYLRLLLTTIYFNFLKRDYTHLPSS